MARADVAYAGPRSVQLRYRTDLTGEEYVNACVWMYARLAACPNHARGGCSLSRRGTYERKIPRGCLVPRWYCREGHTTFSLLPGTLRRLEKVVAVAEAAPSLAPAAVCLCRGEAVGLEGARRWVRRRVRQVNRDLHIARRLRPDLLRGCPARMIPVRGRVRSLIALMRLPGVLAGQLPVLPPPWPRPASAPRPRTAMPDRLSCGGSPTPAGPTRAPDGRPSTECAPETAPPPPPGPRTPPATRSVRAAPSCTPPAASHRATHSSRPCAPARSAAC